MAIPMADSQIQPGTHVSSTLSSPLAAECCWENTTRGLASGLRWASGAFGSQCPVPKASSSSCPTAALQPSPPSSSGAVAPLLPRDLLQRLFSPSPHSREGSPSRSPCPRSSPLLLPGGLVRCLFFCPTFPHPSVGHQPC